MRPGLESLDLAHGCWDRLPPALAAATSLTELSLAESSLLVLITADVDGILCRLPRLRYLYLDVARMPAHVLAQLAECAPHLQISGEP